MLHSKKQWNTLFWSHFKIMILILFIFSIVKSGIPLILTTSPVISLKINKQFIKIGSQSKKNAEILRFWSEIGQFIIMRITWPMLKILWSSFCQHLLFYYWIVKWKLGIILKQKGPFRGHPQKKIKKRSPKSNPIPESLI